MLNEEKVKSMTKAASYEKGPERKNLEITNYYKRDYIGLQMIKSAIAYTVVFCLLVALWSVTDTEQLMLQLTHADYFQKLLKILVIIFLVGLVLYEAGVYIYFSWVYKTALASVERFQAHLKKISKFYETEESAEEIIELDLPDEEMTL